MAYCKSKTIRNNLFKESVKRTKGYLNKFSNTNVKNRKRRMTKEKIIMGQKVGQKMSKPRSKNMIVVRRMMTIKNGDWSQYITS